MKIWIWVLIGSVVHATAASAQGNDACAVASHLVVAEATLPRAAAAIAKDRDLRVAVAGTSSSTLPGASGAKMAYPARLEAALAALFPGVAVQVTAAATPRQTAADMMQAFPRILVDAKPTLVVWQSGTFDAVRGVDPDEFRAVLDEGIITLQTGGADVILMNMQYSPRTELVIALGPYAEAMRFVALEREVPLFDRFAIMKHWSEAGTFDLYSQPKNLDIAAQVHDCLGRLLADLIAAAVKLAEPTKEVR
jgi:hypothetical protein